MSIKPARIGACLLVLLAGCSTEWRPAQSPATRAGNPSTRPKAVATEVERVSEAPRPAPPPPPVMEARVTETNSLDEQWLSLSDWAHERGYEPLRAVPGAAVPAFQLCASNHTLEIRANSLMAEWDGVEFLLGFEPQLQDGELLVHALDVEKNLVPLFEGLPFPLKSEPVIVIDPGHGGQNTGTTSVLDGVPEKEYTLDWAIRLAPLLAANGCRVYLTRTNDVDVSLAERVAFAESCRANLFISLHFNSAAPNREQCGLETFCLTPSGMPSSLTRDYEDNRALVFTNNACDAENLEYALRLQRSILQTVGMADRGVRRARFMGVLRGQSCPAVLIEGGYLSNPEEAGHIADAAYRQKLAEAVAAALAPKPTLSGPVSETASREIPPGVALPDAGLSNSPSASPQIR